MTVKPMPRPAAELMEQIRERRAELIRQAQEKQAAEKQGSEKGAAEKKADRKKNKPGGDLFSN